MFVSDYDESRTLLALSLSLARYHLRILSNGLGYDYHALFVDETIRASQIDR
jgi:hypothetical protein